MKQKKTRSIHDITGQHFGRLTALRPTAERYNGCVVWHCRCVCGNEKDVSLNNLMQGYTTSCGCAQRRFRKGNK